MYQLSQIWVYPIKSMGGISLKSSAVNFRGLKFDRRWMLIDENNRFISQRENASLALFKIEISEESLLINHPSRKEALKISYPEKSGETATVQVWDDACQANVYPDDINSWFSSILNLKCKLVYMFDDSNRFKIKEGIEGTHPLSFSDGYPVLILGDATFKELNDKLADKIKINRFRPNLVFSGGLPSEEANWKTFELGSSAFIGVKSCARCNVTTINQETLETGKEPLKTLATYKRKDQQVVFGENLFVSKEGRVKLGDEISIQSLK